MSSDTDIDIERINTGNVSGFTRIVDRETGVVCYLTDHGVSCLPLSETDLSE
jgi:hypothetical protein